MVSEDPSGMIGFSLEYQLGDRRPNCSTFANLELDKFEFH